jgi:hypothetical protein
MEEFEHISCAVGLPKVVVYLFFVDLGKKIGWAPPVSPKFGMRQKITSSLNLLKKINFEKIQFF